MIYTENYTGQKALFGTDGGGGGEGGLDLSCNVLPEILRPHRELDLELTQQGFGMKRCKC